MSHSVVRVVTSVGLFAVLSAQAEVTLYEYMDVSGNADAGQRVVTSYTPTNATVVRARYSLAVSSGDSRNTALFCARKNSSYGDSNFGYAFFSSVSGKPRFDYYKKAYPGDKGIAKDKVYDLVISNGVATITADGSLVESISAKEWKGESFTASGPMVLFSSNTSLSDGKPSGWGNGFYGRFYYLEIFEPDEDGVFELKHRYVPCKQDGTVALCDMVNKDDLKVLSTAGGSFTIAEGTPEISQGPEIAATRLAKNASGIYEATVTLADEGGTVWLEVSAEGQEKKVYPGDSMTPAGGTASFELTDLVPDAIYTVKAFVSGAKGSRRQTIGRARVNVFQDGVWIGGADGNWSNPLNWQDGKVASGIGATATFANSAVAETTVTVDQDVTVGRIVLANDGDAQQKWNIVSSDTVGLSLDADGLGGAVTLDVGDKVVLGLARFRGTVPVRKIGTGGLRLSTENTSSLYSGSLQVCEGDLEVAHKKCLSSMTLVLGGGTAPVRVLPTNLGEINNGPIAIDGDSENRVSIDWSINNTIKFTGSLNLKRPLVMNNKYNVHLTGKVTASGSGGLHLVGGGGVLLQRYEGGVGSVKVSKGEIVAVQFTAPVNWSRMTFGDDETGNSNVGFRAGDGDQRNALTLGDGASLHFTDKGTGSAFIATHDATGTALTLKAPVQVDRVVKVSNTGANYAPASSKYGLRLDGVVSGVGGLLLCGKDATHYVCLNGANTYSGGTVVTNGFARVLSSGTLGTGGVTVGGARLQLSTGAAIADDATLKLEDGATVKAVLELDDGIEETVGQLFIGGKLMYAGVWGASGSGAKYVDDEHFAGTGRLVVASGRPAGLILIVK